MPWYLAVFSDENDNESPLPSDDGEDDHNVGGNGSITSSPILACGASVLGTVLRALHILTTH